MEGNRIVTGALVALSALVVLAVGVVSARSRGVDVLPFLGAADTPSAEELSIHNEEPSVSMNGGTMPENWPPDAPAAYVDSVIVYSGESNPITGEAGSAVVYTNAASTDSVIEYYTSRLRAEGWVIESSQLVAGYHVITARKDGRLFAAYIAAGADGLTGVTAGVKFE